MKRKEKKNLPSSPVKKTGWWIFAGILLLSIVPDLFVKKKAYFHAVETVPGFFALLGLISALLVFLLAKLLEPLLKRREDYYE